MIDSVGVPRGDMDGNVVDANDIAPSGDGSGSSVEWSHALRSLARARAREARE